MLLVGKILAVPPGKLFGCFPGLLKQFLDDLFNPLFIQFASFIHFLALNCRLEQADYIKTDRIPGAHRHFQIFRDTLL